MNMTIKNNSLYKAELMITCLLGNVLWTMVTERTNGSWCRSCSMVFCIFNEKTDDVVNGVSIEIKCFTSYVKRTGGELINENVLPFAKEIIMTPYV